jgi:hypothetical protein
MGARGLISEFRPYGASGSSSALLEESSKACVFTGRRHEAIGRIISLKSCGGRLTRHACGPMTTGLVLSTFTTFGC